MKKELDQYHSAISSLIDMLWAAQPQSASYLLFKQRVTKSFPFIKEMVYDFERNYFEIIFKDIPNASVASKKCTCPNSLMCGNYCACT